MSTIVAAGGGVLLVLVLGFWFGSTGRRRVPNGHVGVIYRKRGAHRVGDNAAVSVFGAPGPQAQLVPANTRYWTRPFHFHVKHVPYVRVPSGTIGLVVARAGAVRSSGDGLAAHVDCDFFQDAERFLRRGGEQGRQPLVLPSGAYAINPEVFEVITVDRQVAARREGLEPESLREIELRVGEIGVVVTHFGTKAPVERNQAGAVVDGHESYRKPWVFLAGGGQRGVQEETLDEGGRYLINPWFAHVVRIPTRVLVLEWNEDPKSEDNLDVSLDQIKLDVQGHTVRLDMKQTVQIPAEAAPRLVRRFGDLGSSGRAAVKGFVEKELAATVDGYFRRISGRARIIEFLTRRDEVSNELASEVRHALDLTGVRAISTTIGDFEFDDQQLNEHRKAIAVQFERTKLERAKLEGLEAQVINERATSEIELQRVKVEEQRRRLEYTELNVMVELLGSEHTALQKIVAELVKGDVPQYVGGDSGVTASLLQAMPFMQARDLVMGLQGMRGAKELRHSGEQAEAE
ncbi:SPFH domain-containing protein [Actinokineospora auranticolor]|uniref:SPFH domain/Band 7 family protein n=1 Tax=Actinokineospora auranticolor TaxID=155976 RepID=A0A2S6GRV6_9PSEU|nr:SPFH domain-containing protein [Actinokineospora auranticolor]PPK67861.1 SPFH domain/Band 7 family protein [Actinokineospora auranticolor]